MVGGLAGDGLGCMMQDSNGATRSIDSMIARNTETCKRTDKFNSQEEWTISMGDK